MRDTAGEEIRALVTYETDSEDMPVSRDALFVSVLAGLVSEAITSVSKNDNDAFDLRGLYENLLAMVGLEEAIGTREPRNSCKEGLL